MPSQAIVFPVSTWCPVCHGSRTDNAAIYIHNERCARFGERAYPKANK